METEDLDSVGCGFHNDGTFNVKWSGIVGLEGGEESLITQLGSFINGKFSYCLVLVQSQTKITSKLNFGRNVIVSGSQVVSTPIVQDKNPKTLYFLTLEAISVADTEISFPPLSSGSVEGNIIIDSGTTVTILPHNFYSDLETEVDKAIGKERVDVTDVPLRLCYKSIASDDDFKAPILNVHFCGADVKLKAVNTFIRINEEIVCFAFAPAKNIAIYGNLSQMNFLVGYDLKKKIVSFKPTDCTKH